MKRLEWGHTFLHRGTGAVARRRAIAGEHRGMKIAVWPWAALAISFIIRSSRTELSRNRDSLQTLIMNKHIQSFNCWVLSGILGVLVLTVAANSARAQSPWRFVVVGDTRGSSSSAQINTNIVRELANEIVRHSPVFAIVSGDMVYSGNLGAFQGWKALMAPVYQAGIHVYPVIGNHDATDVNAFIQTFGPDLPDNGPAGEVNRTYAFAYDNVLVLGLDTYVNVGRVNQPWVDAILANNTLPHVFAFGHMPAFKANHTDCLDDYPTQRDAFWTSLRNAGGRSYFCGHDHFYDHMRVGDGDGNPENDLHQLIVGGGGAPLAGGFTYDGANTIWSPTPVYHDMQYGYTVVEVDGLTITMTYYHRTGANTYVPTSEVWTYTVGGGPTPPAAPTGLTATAGNAQVALKWQASAGATSYTVRRTSGTPSGPYTTIASGVTTTAYTDTTVANGTTYYYAVAAVNEVGESSSSAYVSATPKAPPTVPSAPATLTASTGAKKGQIKLSWAPSTGATTYTLKRASTSGGAYVTVKAGITSSTYADNKLVSGNTYYYVVTAVNSAGESPNSPEASAKAK